MNHQHPQSGFSLIEALVSLVVLSVGMIGMAALYGQGLSAGRTALYRTVAVNLTADMADRIRANRLGDAAYNGAGADNNCDAGDNNSCTPAEMAAHDIWVWNQQVVNSLPGAASSVTYAPGAGAPPSFTIRVTWAEPGLPAAAQELVVQVPNI